MFKFTFAGLLCSLLLLSGVVSAQTFRAMLGGTQEVPAVTSTGFGQVTAALSGNQLVVTGSFQQLRSPFDPTVGGGAHLHLGYAGENGPVTLPLVTTVGPGGLSGTFAAAANTFTLNADQLAALNARRLYVNIHTEQFQPGEIRGQLLLDADAHFHANLYGSNEVPSVMTVARGAVSIELSGDSLVVTGTFAGLESDFNTAVGAHLHLGLAGENGPIALGLNPLVGSNNRSGTFLANTNTLALSADQASALMARRMYVNIHSVDIPSGEIRGQVVGAASNAVFRSFLSGSNERPAVTSLAGGALVLEVQQDTVIATGTFNGLESDFNAAIGAHLHLGYAGQNGPIAVDLDPDLDDDNRGGTFGMMDNTFTLTADQKAAMFRRQLYVNIHSVGTPSGEIRGQVVPQAQFFLTGYLSGTNEVPPVATAATGGVIAEFSGGQLGFGGGQLGGQLRLSGSFTNLESDFDPNVAGGSHLHLGYAGQNGPIDFTLTPMLMEGNRSGIFLADSNTFEFHGDEPEWNQLLERRYYVNIHTQDNPAGEVRGQLLGEAATYFVATLGGASEVPPVMTEATGAVIGELTGEMLVLSGAFRNLESPFNTNIGAHFHAGYAGQNGPVVIGLDPTLADGGLSGVFAIEDNMYELSTGAIDTLRRRQFYVNVHSQDNAPGEIRGQMLPLAQLYFAAALSGLNEVQPVATDAIGGLVFELNGNQLTATGAFMDLDSAFNTNIGSHLHLAPAGANGPVEVFLIPSLADDSLSGVYLADSNQIELSAALRTALRDDNLYVNIHSLAFPSGELRGQVLGKINFFPEAATITAPADDAALTIEGPDTTAFTATWTTAEDPNEHTVVYIWQLAADADFETILVNASVGTETAFTTTFGVVDELLASAGLGVGDQVTLFHRAVSSDGSVRTPGNAFEVNLTRGEIITNLQDLTSRFEVNAYPSPARDQLTVAIHALETQSARVRLVDMTGRTVASEALTLRAGDNQYILPMQGHPTGTYFVQVLVNGQALPVQKIVKE